MCNYPPFCNWKHPYGFIKTHGIQALALLELMGASLPLCFSVQFSFLGFLNVGSTGQREALMTAHDDAGTGPQVGCGSSWEKDLPLGTVWERKDFPSALLAHEGKLSAASLAIIGPTTHTHTHHLPTLWGDWNVKEKLKFISFTQPCALSAWGNAKRQL